MLLLQIAALVVGEYLQIQILDYPLDTLVFALISFILFFNLCLFIFILLFFMVLLSQIDSISDDDDAATMVRTAPIRL